MFLHIQLSKFRLNPQLTHIPAQFLLQIGFNGISKSIWSQMDGARSSMFSFDINCRPEELEIHNYFEILSKYEEQI